MSCDGRLPSLFEIVVVDLDPEDDRTHDRREEVGDEQGDVACQDALHGEAGRAEPHHQEGARGDVVGGAGANGTHGLGQVPEDHGDGGDRADNIRWMHSALLFANIAKIPIFVSVDHPPF